LDRCAYSTVIVSDEDICTQSSWIRSWYSET
jgi:hypothetical protein